MTGSASSSTRFSSDELREQQMLQVAKLYYGMQKTQNEIAEAFDLTRWQVSRLLQEARDRGIVRIEIVPLSRRMPDLEIALQRDFGLVDAVVVPADGLDEEAVAMESVAQAAGQYLAALTPKPALFGVSWGRTMAAVARWLPSNWHDGVHVVLVNGATSLRISSKQSNLVAERFAEAGNGTATLLPAPAIVGNRNTRVVLEQDPMIARVLDLARGCEVICFTLGPLSHRSVLVQSGYLDPEQIDALGAAGALGDVLGHFIGADGRPVDADLDARTIGLRPEALRACPKPIAVVSGSAKHAVTLAALRAGLVKVLVTDEATARYVLENGHDRRRAHRS